ncbi:MAG: pilus assembly protein [Telluria sp.]
MMRRLQAVLCALLLAGAMAAPGPGAPDIPDFPPWFSGEGWIYTNTVLLPMPPGGWLRTSFNAVRHDLGELERLDGGAVSWRGSAGIPLPDRRRLYTAVERAATVATVAVPAGPLYAAPLGAIVRSQPLVVGPPGGGIAQDTYFSFAERLRDRPVTVYVGAGDGLLHAFDAASGAERYAFLPQAFASILDGRPRLDGSAASGDAFAAGRWRTVLASGHGMAATGLFVLDVSDPSQQPEALWQFTGSDDGHMGHILAPPSIVALRDGQASGWYVVSTSGIGPAEGGGALFLLSLDREAGQRWRAGRNYHRISIGDSGGANVLGPPGLALNPDGSVRAIYAGDLNGRLWRFDFSAGALRGVRAELLFAARDATGAPQPITSAPVVAYGPDGNFIVAFGTGRRMEAADVDPARYAPQSLYAVLDTGHAVPDRTALTARTLRPHGDTVDVVGQPMDWSQSRGWYVDLRGAQETGERILSTPLLVDSTLLASSWLPPVGARAYLLDLLTGLPPQQPDGTRAATGDTLAGVFAPLFAASAEASAPDGAGAVSVRLRFTAIAPDGSLRPLSQPVLRRAGRLAWRELSDWSN